MTLERLARLKLATSVIALMVGIGVAVAIGLGAGVRGAAFSSDSCEASVTAGEGDEARGLEELTHTAPLLVQSGSESAIHWRAQAQPAFHDYVGSASLVFGPFAISAENWVGLNPDDAMAAKGLYRPFQQLPIRIAGLYSVEVNHQGREGECAATVYVRVVGNPLVTTPGLISVFLTIATIGWVLLAGTAKKRTNHELPG